MIDQRNKFDFRKSNLTDMKTKFLVFLFVLLSMHTFSQSITITGKVIDNESQPIPGVNVLENETLNGTVTDIDGKYTIKVSDLTNNQLVFSFIGFETQVVDIEERTSINVEMKPTNLDLDEVVVLGYGEVRKRDLTGAVAKVSESESVARQYQTVDALIQGRAAGVQVSSNSGSPGSAISVRIRGTNSLRGNNEPLYVIDGVIISSAAEDVVDASSDGNEYQSAQNGLTGLNPRDIESIEILKDASATAIYGSRGANGVVLITTKSGNNLTDGARVNAYASTEFSWVSKKIDLLDPITFAEFQNEIAIVDGSNIPYHIDGSNIYNISYNTDDDGITTPSIDADPLMQIDWQDEMYNLSISHNEGLSINGNKNKTRYYFSAGYNNIQGVVESTKVKKGDMRLNLSTALSPKLKFDNRIALTHQQGTFAQGGSKSGGSRSFVKQILMYRPVLGADGDNISDEELEVSNPYAWLSDFDDVTEESRVNVSTSLEYQIINGLKYQLRGGMDYRTKDRQKWYGMGIRKGELVNGAADYSNLKRYSYTLDNILTYSKKINKENNLSVTAAVTYDGNNYKNDVYAVENFPVKTLRSEAPQLGQVVVKPYTLIYSEEQIFSTLGRLNYSLKDKYILTASFRADQSSKFAKENQWGYFPSAAFAWRASEESFIKELNIFYNLKLRAGWGQTGNQAINPYQTLSTYSTNYYVDGAGNTVIGNSPSRIANPNLTWETTEQYNAGIDASLFEGRLNLTVDAYYKATNDLLQDIQLPTSAGFSSMTINRGTIQNKGLEIALDGLLVNQKDFAFDLGGHISFNKGTITGLGIAPSAVYIDGVERMESYYLGNSVSTGSYFKSPANIFMEGQPIGMFWGYETNGVYADQAAASAGPTYSGTPNQAGDIIYVDQNGDGNIDPYDRTFIGDPNPDFMFGFNFEFNYKGFTLKALFDGVYGNEIANGYNMTLAIPENNSKNILRSTYENTWRSDVEVTDQTGPRIGYTMNGKAFSDIIIEDGSYLRLNNITLGYDIPISSKIFDNVNVYVSGMNLFYLTNYSGYEPQVTSYIFDSGVIGVDWMGAPNVKTILGGINITF